MSENLSVQQQKDLFAHLPYSEEGFPLMEDDEMTVEQILGYNEDTDEDGGGEQVPAAPCYSSPMSDVATQTTEDAVVLPTPMVQLKDVAVQVDPMPSNHILLIYLYFAGNLIFLYMIICRHKIVTLMCRHGKIFL